MFKYLVLILKLGLFILFNYPKILRYSRKKDKYPLSVRYEYGRKLIKRIDKALKVDFHICGKENMIDEGNVVFLGNHQSNFDPLLLIDLFETPTTFVSKIETLKFPFVGRVATFLDVLFMDRNDLRQSLNIMKEVAKRLKEDQARFVIFPEGTRSKDDLKTIAEFKPGAFKAPMKAEATIVPVAIFGSYKPLNTKYHQKKYRVDIHFFEPIRYEDYKDLSTYDLASKVEEMIKEKVSEFRLNQPDMVELLKNED